MFICHIFINLSHVMVMVFRILAIMSDDDLDLQCIDQQTFAGDELTNIQKKTRHRAINSIY